jgi:hypothetical protein
VIEIDMDEGDDEPNITIKENEPSNEVGSRFNDAVSDVLNAGVEFIAKGAERSVDAVRHFGMGVLKLLDDPIYSAFYLRIYATDALRGVRKKLFRR